MAISLTASAKRIQDNIVQSMNGGMASGRNSRCSNGVKMVRVGIIPQSNTRKLKKVKSPNDSIDTVSGDDTIPTFPPEARAAVTRKTSPTTQVRDLNEILQRKVINERSASLALKTRVSTPGSKISQLGSKSLMLNKPIKTQISLTYDKRRAYPSAEKHSATSQQTPGNNN